MVQADLRYDRCKHKFFFGCCGFVLGCTLKLIRLTGNRLSANSCLWVHGANTRRAISGTHGTSIRRRLGAHLAHGRRLRTSFAQTALRRHWAPLGGHRPLARAGRSTGRSTLAVGVYGRSRTRARGRARLDGTSRQASPGDDTLVRAIKFDAKSL